MKKPEVAGIAMHSPIEYADLKRPRPSSTLRPRPSSTSARLAEQVFTTRPEPRRTLRELEHQAWELRMDKLFRDQRVLDELANRRERRIRPTLADLRARLERATR